MGNEKLRKIISIVAIVVVLGIGVVSAVGWLRDFIHPGPDRAAERVADDIERIERVGEVYRERIEQSSELVESAGDEIIEARREIVEGREEIETGRSGVDDIRTGLQKLRGANQRLADLIRRLQEEGGIESP